MKNVPIKLNSFRKDAVNYYVGLDGTFGDRADAVSAATVLIKKLMQIKAYCAKYNKPVVVIVDSSRVPSYIHSTLRGLNTKFLSVVTRDADAKYTDYYVHESPLVFLAESCDVVIFLKNAETEEEVDLGDYETPKVVLNYSTLPLRETMLLSPDEVVRNAPQTKIDNGSPYAQFFHEPFFRRVPYTYWQDLMDTMPDTKGMINNGTPNNVF